MDSVSGIPALSNYFNNNAPINPVFIIIIVVAILIYVILFTSLGSGSNEYETNMNSGSGRLLGIILASFFIVLLIINGFNYIFNIDIITTIKKIFTN